MLSGYAQHMHVQVQWPQRWLMHASLLCLLWLDLLQERHNASSFWKPYMDVLPQHYRSMPIFFTAQELSYLRGRSHAHAPYTDGSLNLGRSALPIHWCLRCFCLRLSGSFTLAKIADRHAELKDEYDNIVRHVPTFVTYPLEGETRT
jgi:hypothetical protein